MSAQQRWVNSDMLRMARSLDEQADAITDEQDPRGLHRAGLYRASANLVKAYAEVLVVQNLGALNRRRSGPER